MACLYGCNSDWSKHILNYSDWLKHCVNDSDKYYMQIFNIIQILIKILIIFSIILIELFSADSFTIIPTANLGTHYVAVGTLFQLTREGPNAIMAIAYQDNTTV